MAVQLKIVIHVRCDCCKEPLAEAGISGGMDEVVSAMRAAEWQIQKSIPDRPNSIRTLCGVCAVTTHRFHAGVIR